MPTATTLGPGRRTNLLHYGAGADEDTRPDNCAHANANDVGDLRTINSEASRVSCSRNRVSQASTSAVVGIKPV
jgi:hypothetical protein